MSPKQRAAEAALQFVQSDATIGLGSGSTAEFFVRALGEALRTGRLKNVRGVPTSDRTEQLAREVAIPLTTLAHQAELDVTVDGADEVSESLNLIKGLGGALLREKIVAQNSKRLVIVIDQSKRVDVLGVKSPVPVEVAPFAHEAQERFLRSLGCLPTLRMTADGKPFVTDNGNFIYDCKFDRISDPHALQAALAQRAGVIETGLFLGMHPTVIVGDEQTVRIL